MANSGLADGVEDRDRTGVIGRLEVICVTGGKEELKLEARV